MSHAVQSSSFKVQSQGRYHHEVIHDLTLTHRSSKRRIPLRSPDGAKRNPGFFIHAHRCLCHAPHHLPGFRFASIQATILKPILTPRIFKGGTQDTKTELKRIDHKGYKELIGREARKIKYDLGVI